MFLPIQHVSNEITQSSEWRTCAPHDEEGVSGPSAWRCGKPRPVAKPQIAPGRRAGGVLLEIDVSRLKCFKHVKIQQFCQFSGQILIVEAGQLFSKAQTLLALFQGLSMACARQCMSGFTCASTPAVRCIVPFQSADL